MDWLLRPNTRKIRRDKRIELETPPQVDSELDQRVRKWMSESSGEDLDDVPSDFNLSLKDKSLKDIRKSHHVGGRFVFATKQSLSNMISRLTGGCWTISNPTPVDQSLSVPASQPEHCNSCTGCVRNEEEIFQ
jgi:hypothetical protein